MQVLYGILFGLLVLVAGYLMGSIPNAVLIAKRRGVDITKVGSGNPGGTNVWRNLGYRAGLLCMTLDLAKSFSITFLVVLLLAFVPQLRDGSVLPLMSLQGHDHLNVYVCLTGLGTILGHSFPVFFRFRGGKNVMVTLGFLLATSPLMALLLLMVFLTALALSKRVAVGSLAAAIGLLPVGLIPVLLALYGVPGYQYCGWYFAPNAFFLCDWVYYVFLLFMGLLVVWRHHANIESLVEHQSHPDI